MQEAVYPLRQLYCTSVVSSCTDGRREVTADNACNDVMITHIYDIQSLQLPTTCRDVAVHAGNCIKER